MVILFLYDTFLTPFYICHKGNIVGSLTGGAKKFFLGASAEGFAWASAEGFTRTSASSRKKGG